MRISSMGALLFKKCQPGEIDEIREEARLWSLTFLIRKLKGKERKLERDKFWSPACKQGGRSTASA